MRIVENKRHLPSAIKRCFESNKEIVLLPLVSRTDKNWITESMEFRFPAIYCLSGTPFTGFTTFACHEKFGSAPKIPSNVTSITTPFNTFSQLLFFVSHFEHERIRRVLHHGETLSTSKNRDGAVINLTCNICPRVNPMKRSTYCSRLWSSRRTSITEFSPISTNIPQPHIKQLTREYILLIHAEQSVLYYVIRYESSSVTTQVIRQSYFNSPLMQDVKREFSQ